MKIDRRNFMKGIAGVVAGVSVLRAEENPKVSYDPRPKRATTEKPSMNDCVGAEAVYHNRKVWSYYESSRIYWTKYGDLQSWQVESYIDIPTYDRFRFFTLVGDSLWWHGKHEIWEVFHIGGTRTFVCQLVKQLLKRESLPNYWRPVGIMGAIRENPGHLQAYCKEAMSKGNFIVIEKVDDYGNIWVAPVKDFSKT